MEEKLKQAIESKEHYEAYLAYRDLVKKSNHSKVTQKALYEACKYYIMKYDAYKKFCEENGIPFEA